MARFRDKRLYSRGGRFIWARVTDEHGIVQRFSTRCTTEAAASAWADEYERKAADPNYKRATQTTLGDAIADWLEEQRRRRVSAATYEIAEIKSGHFARLWGVEWPMMRVDADLVLQYIDTREGEGVKPLTVKKELGALKGILEWARFRGTYSRDLATVLPPRYSGQHKPRTRWLTLDEAKALLAELDPHRAAHVAFIIATGARRAESLRALREDIRLTDANPHVLIRGSKTELAFGTVPVTALTHPLLVFAMHNAPGKVVLFQKWGKMVRDLAAACVRAGIEKASANDLRRTFGTWHRRAGVPAEQIAVMLRHTTDTLAQTTYGRISGADIGPMLRTLPGLALPSADSTSEASGEAQPPPDTSTIVAPGVVSVLYATTTKTTSNEANVINETSEFMASPAGFEPATPGLGNQRATDASNAYKSESESSNDPTRTRPIVPVLYATESLESQVAARARAEALDEARRACARMVHLVPSVHVPAVERCVAELDALRGAR